MKILIIAPLPPPMSGNALPVKILYEELKKENDVEVINLNKTKRQPCVISFNRILQILIVLKEVWKKQKKQDVVYLTIAESFLGNIRDMIIYLICRARLQSMIIHMLGGAGMRNILNNGKGPRFLSNKLFLSRLGGIIAEGMNQFEMFSKAASPSRIHVIPNFAEMHIFVTREEISDNFNKFYPLRILFLSNMLYGKGHIELLDSYLKLDEKLREKIEIDFAGEVVFQSDEKYFSLIIGKHNNIKCHGPVSGLNKKRMYAQAHIYCLPTYYPYEGQPFCILEAYASGCAVITTNHSGIGDIFTDGINGYEVEKRSVDSLVFALEKAIKQRDNLRNMAINNLRLAKEKYTQSRFIESMKQAIGSLNVLH
ncbi:glycosyltransferase family 4 protein [Desulfococcaceae bacterium HSG7]|nr:glycosyltransferase family 4 protein [Desulfococcaceae bacterium HSG7]